MERTAVNQYPDKSNRLSFQRAASLPREAPISVIIRASPSFELGFGEVGSERTQAIVLPAPSAGCTTRLASSRPLVQLNAACGRMIVERRVRAHHRRTLLSGART